MAYRAASDVAEMESDIVLLRSDNESLRVQLSLAIQERDKAKTELALAAARAEEQLIRATQMQTIMTQVSSGLIAGLSLMKEEQRVQSESRRIAEDRSGYLRTAAARATREDRAAPIEPPAHPRDLDGDLSELDELATPVPSPRMRAATFEERQRRVEATLTPEEKAQMSERDPLPIFLQHRDPRMPHVDLRNDSDDLRDHAARMIGGERG